MSDISRATKMEEVEVCNYKMLKLMRVEAGRRIQVWALNGFLSLSGRAEGGAAQDVQTID